MHVCWRMVELASLAGNSQLFAVHHKMYFSFFSLSIALFIFLSLLFLKLKYSWFTMLCQSLLSISESVIYLYTFFIPIYISKWASLVAKTVKNLPAMQETGAWSLGLENPLENKMATHSSVLSGEFHIQRSLAGYGPWGYKELDMFSSVQLLSHVRLFVTPWTIARQVSLSITNSRSPPNPCPLCRWSHPVISSSVFPFSSCRQSLPGSGSFPVSQLFASGGQSTGVSASTSVPPMNTQDWSPLSWTGWISLQSKGLSRVFASTTVQKDQFFCTQLSF